MNELILYFEDNILLIQNYFPIRFQTWIKNLYVKIYPGYYFCFMAFLILFPTLTGRRFLTLYKGNCNSVYHTEEWLPCGSTLFSPLTEDIMVNTQNIEQFSSTHGQFCVSDESGQYSTTLTGDYCTSDFVNVKTVFYLFCKQQSFFNFLITISRKALISSVWNLKKQWFTDFGWTDGSRLKS